MDQTFLPPEQRHAYLLRAIELANAGQRAEATQMLRYLLRQDPSIVVAWRWLIYATPDQREARAAIEYLLRLNPGDEWARQAWDRFQMEHRAARTPVQRPPAERPVRRGIMPLWLSLGGLAVAGAVIVLGMGLRYIAQFESRDDSAAFPLMDAVATVPPPVQPKPQVRVNSAIDYYSFEANSMREIQAHLYNSGPQIGDGDHSIAVTTYELSVNWEMAQMPSGCLIENAVVNLNLRYTYPNWVRSGSVPTSLVEQWDDFVAHVIAHEQTHGNIALGCANEIVDSIAAMPPQSSCQTLESTLNNLIDAAYSACEDRQQAYDNVEGRTTFPLP